ncbi:AAA family ATPase [Bradyrhizobium sp. CW9]|uniref:AAA family ATPase n=1 Tax=Bradyrhizobium sp. CW9 TaxID=2782689 RepID=UPI001FF8B794|nr:AAA family ATPase [Bradyrhizobium sp. CW9]MCK1328621.1 AAA family ATPase [Bradyrhizobium sp. CW9]
MIRLGGYAGPDLSFDPYVVELKRSLWDYLRRSPYDRAQRRAPIAEDFYFSSSVAEAVTNRCLGKCVFCERDRSLVRIEVATFRPLRDAGGRREYADHYAWLAYEPENLILICIECSSRRRTEFPLLGERAPYLAGMEEVRRRERPLTVDPYRGQPDKHFVFLTDGRIGGATAEGRTTIALFGLDNEYLFKQRWADIGQFIDELRNAISQRIGNRVVDIFHRSRPFAGARVGIARRIFEGIEVAGERLEGATTFRQRLERAVSIVTPADQRRLLGRIDALVAEDASRRVEPSTYSIQDFGRVLGRDGRLPRHPTGGIARIEFIKFKGIDQLVLETIPGRVRSKGTPCLMLLGENAVGKSSILQGIALALIGESEARRLRIDPSELFHAKRGLRWDQLTPEDATVSIDFRISGRSTMLLLDAATRKLNGDAPRSSPLVLGYGPHRYFDPRWPDRPDADHARVRTLFRSTAALPFPSSWLNALDLQSFDEVAKVLRIVLALSDEDEIVRDVDGRICVALDGVPVPIERLSEGYRSIFAMVADIARELMRDFRYLEEAEAIVLIDEIDIHLHPRWKMRVMGALRRALPRVQFVVTTHDPLCLRGMEDGEVLVLQRNEAGQIISLLDLPSIKGMRSDQLLTSDFFGLSSTIDPETELDVARFVHAVGDLPAARVEEANRLVRQLVLGDDALEQVVQEALKRFLAERERPTGALRTHVREEAVRTILNALRSGAPRRPDAEPRGP